MAQLLFRSLLTKFMMPEPFRNDRFFFWRFHSDTFSTFLLIFALKMFRNRPAYYVLKCAKSRLRAVRERIIISMKRYGSCLLRLK